MTPSYTTRQLADHFAPVFAILARWDTEGVTDPEPVPVTLGNGAVCSMTRNWLTFPRADGAVSGKSLSLRQLQQLRATQRSEEQLAGELHLRGLDSDSKPV
ncbi:hypothetical protein, partial [Streptomyces roseolus]|uniref:hypothetical protein n=1 Tax=Streptomyces roseolus TaxID=67358 RepID=UPI00365BA289